MPTLTRRRLLLAGGARWPRLDMGLAIDDQGAMYARWTQLRRLIGTLILALSVAWVPLAATAQSMEMAKAMSISASDDMGGMTMDDMSGMAIDELTGDCFDPCTVDMAFNASCSAVGGLSIPALGGGLAWPGLVSAATFAWLVDPDPREQVDRPPFQPPKLGALV